MRGRSRLRLIVTVWLVGMTACYLLLPSLGPVLLEHWLADQGYRDVSVQLGYPGLTDLKISTLRLTQDVGGEQLSVALEDMDLRYSLSTLLAGRVTRIVLPRGTVQLTPLGVARRQAEDDDESTPSLLTLGDLSKAVPLLPFDELILGQLSVMREQATGPLRSLTLAGSVRQGAQQAEADLTLQGQSGSAYHLTLSGQSAASLTWLLRADDPQSAPIIAWQSQATPDGSRVSLRGQAQVQVQELAPFIAWLVPIGSEWQGVTGTILAGWAGTASSIVPITSVWADASTEIQGHVQAQASLPEVKGFGKTLSLGFVASFTGNAQRMTWSLAPGRVFSAVVNAPSRLFPEALRGAVPSGEQPFQIDAPREVTGTAQWAKAPTTASFDGPIAASYGKTTGAQRTEVTVTHLTMSGTEVGAVDGILRLEGTMPKALHDLLPVRTAMGMVVGTFAVDREGIRTVLTPPSHLRFREWRQRDLVIPDGELLVMDTMPARWTFATSRWAVGPSSLALNIPEARWAEHAVNTGRSTLQILSGEGSTTTWQLRGKWHVEGVAPVAGTWPIPPTDWKVTLDATQSHMTADVRAETRDHRVTLTAKVTHEPAAQRGVLNATVGPVSFDRTLFRLSQFMTPWPYPFDLTEGQVSVKVDGAWGTDRKTPLQGIQLQSGTMSLSVNGLSGRYRNIPVNGVTSTVALQVAGGMVPAMPQPATISIASINPGVEMTNVAMTVQPEWQNDGTLSAVAVREVRWQMFGGEVTSPGLKAVLATPPFTLPLTLRRLDLEKILSVEQQQGLQGTGIVDGTIPVILGATGVSVNDGTLAARPPGGVIRYGASDETAKAVTQSNAAMTLVLQALNNFHYNVLQVEVDYTENGTLLLKTRLEGRNPDQKKSPPIHFNLTVQENIPALLKSLQLVQEIEDSVQRTFQRP